MPKYFEPYRNRYIYRLSWLLHDLLGYDHSTKQIFGMSLKWLPFEQRLMRAFMATIMFSWLQEFQLHVCRDELVALHKFFEMLRFADYVAMYSRLNQKKRDYTSFDAAKGDDVLKFVALIAAKANVTARDDRMPRLRGFYGYTCADYAILYKSFTHEKLQILMAARAWPQLSMALYRNDIDAAKIFIYASGAIDEYVVENNELCESPSYKILRVLGLVKLYQRINDFNYHDSWGWVDMDPVNADYDPCRFDQRIWSS